LDNNSVNEKSLELIRKTKEFLQLKKNYDDIQSVFLVIKQAKDETGDGGGRNIEQLPERVLALVRTAGNLDQAEDLALAKMKELKERMSNLSVQIRKISEQLEPYIGKSVGQARPPQKSGDAEQSTG
jgi:predicted  nucleic acid-binding Zn-ribbon protein